jgi:hypothetical protein
MDTHRFKQIVDFHLQNSDLEDCCICLEKTKSHTKKCNHPICPECFYQLREKNRVVHCPICRKFIIKKRIKQSHPNLTPSRSFINPFSSSIPFRFLNYLSNPNETNIGNATISSPNLPMASLPIMATFPLF